MRSKIREFWDLLMSHQLYRTVNIVIYVFYFVISDFGIDYIPYVVSFFWGITIIAWDFFTKRLMFKQPYWFILLGLCISFGITILTNLPASILFNGMHLVYLAIAVFIFYCFDSKVSRDKRNKDFQIMNDIYIWITFILALISILMFVFNISYLAPDGSRQGFIENRLFGVYTSPNISSMFGYVSVILMSVNNYLKRGSWKKFQKFYYVNGATQYILYILSGSRGTRLALIAFVIFLVLIQFMKEIVNHRKITVQIGRTILFAGVFLVGINFVNTGIKEGLSYVPSFVLNIINPVSEEVIETNGETIVVKKDKPIKKIVIQHSEEGSELSAGRFTIWEAGFQLVKQKPLFGVGDAYVYRNGQLSPQLDEEPLTELHIRELRRAKGNMHNTYLAVLVKGGIISFLLLAVFVALILKDNYKFLMDKRVKFQSEEIQIYVILLAFLLSLFANDLVENHLVFNNRDVMGIVFWSYLGFLNHFRIDKLSKIESKG